MLISACNILISLVLASQIIITKQVFIEDANETNTKFDDEEKKFQYEDVWILWQKFPLAVMNSSGNPECKKAYNNYLLGVKNNDINALKMFDATAKLPSGILRGNVNQYGNFDECLEVDDAQYCLADIDLEPVWKQPYLPFKKLVHSHFAIRESFDDPGHRVPGFSFVRWGFCIPKQCSHKDLENSLKESLGVNPRVKPSMCQTKKLETPVLTTGDYVARSFFSAVFLAVLLSTYIHHKYQTRFDNHYGLWYDLLMAFCIQRNYNKFMEIKGENSKEIKAVHGVRALSALALIMSHKTMSLFYNPFINRSVMTSNLGMKWSVIGRTAILYTDCFLMISGLLNANALFSDLQKGKSMNFWNKLITRIFRITPNIVALIMFCTYILPSMGSGPLYPLVVDHHSELCKKYMWRNLLYIHNYFGFENMCLTHTHQVGIDMQLFLVTPIIVYLIWSMKNVGLWIVGIIATISTILRFYVSWVQNLSHVVHFGIPVSRLFDTANFSYILPTHRITIYLIGVVLGYILKFTNPKPTFPKVKLLSWWVIFFGIGLATWLGPVHMSVTDYEYRKIDGAVYGSISPITWGVAIAWIVYATNIGYGGWLGDLLQWKYFERFTKISYAVYLVQFPVFFYNVGLTKHVDEFKPHLFLQFTETCVILAISTIMTLIIEMPFQNIRRILFEKRKAVKADVQPKEVNDSSLRKAKLG